MTRTCLDCTQSLPSTTHARRLRCETCTLRNHRDYHARYGRLARAVVRRVRRCAVDSCEIVVTGNAERCKPHARERAMAYQAAWQRQYREKLAVAS